MRARLLALGQLLGLVAAATALKAPGLRCYAGAADLVEGASVLLDTANPRVNNVGLGLRVFNAGGEFYGEIAAPEPGDGASIRCVVGERLRDRDVAQPLACTLLLAVPKRAERARFACEKATELGAVAIAPIDAALAAPRGLDLFRRDAEKWCARAAEQCERLEPPRLLPPSSLEEACARAEARGEAIYFCAEPSLGAAGSVPAVPLLDALRIRGRRSPAAVVVGPEGGWSAAEVTAVKRACPRATLVSLGTTTLRAETAAVVALALHRGFVDSLG